MKGARVGGLLARGLLACVAAVIVVAATVHTWPWSVAGPSLDERRIADLQRLSQAIDIARARKHVLPASLARIPIDSPFPVRIHDPVTNRPYDYRPLGPLAYELCARFDAARADRPRDFWWHDAGRYCFALETRATPKPPAPAPAATPAVPAAPPASEPGVDPGVQPGVQPAPAPESQPGARPGNPPDPPPGRAAEPSLPPPAPDGAGASAPA